MLVFSLLIILDSFEKAAEILSNFVSKPG